MEIRKPTKNEAIAFGTGYAAGSLTFPYVKKGLMYVGGFAAGLWNSLTSKKDDKGGDKKAA